MQVKRLLSKNSMEKILMKSVQHWDSISRHYNTNILNLMYGTLVGKRQSGHIGEIILNKLMVSYGL